MEDTLCGLVKVEDIVELWQRLSLVTSTEERGRFVEFGRQIIT